MRCRYDAEADAYLVDGERCKRDEWGDPTKHCTARRTCSQHIGRDELTCARCLGRARSCIRQITALSALMLPMVLGETGAGRYSWRHRGVNSEAADLAAPAADPRAIAEIRFYVQGHATHAYRTEKISEATFDKILAALPDEDEWHPYSLLTRWQMMLSEDYGHPLPARLTITGAAAYLERHLHQIAQDPEQDFALLARELRRCQSHLETVLHNSNRAERGVPCPYCLPNHVVRLVREYGHWCDDPECQQMNYRDDSGDEWYCPRNRTEHRWTHASYENYLKDREQAG